MSEPVYLISVMAHGITSDLIYRPDDLLDAVVKAKELMRSPAQRRVTISIVNAAPASEDWPWPLTSSG